MQNITTWFLKQNATTIFLLCFLGIPQCLWYYSIVTEFDKKNKIDNNLKKAVINFTTLYPILYFVFFPFYMIYNIMNSDRIGLENILQYHFLAMFCVLISLILTANSFSTFEKNNKKESFGNVGNFFLFWFFIFGVWILQPKINSYIEQKNTV